MRIVVWNCRMGFDKKRDVLYALKPDVAVIPECSQDAVKLCNGEDIQVVGGATRGIKDSQ